MRVLGLALGGVLAAAAPMAAMAAPLGTNSRAATTGSASGIVKVADGSDSGRHAASGGALHWHPVPGQSSQWKGGWVPSHWGPNRHYGGWGPYGAVGGPVYWVW